MNQPVTVVGMYYFGGSLNSSSSMEAKQLFYDDSCYLCFSRLHFRIDFIKLFSSLCCNLEFNFILRTHLCNTYNPYYTYEIKAPILTLVINFIFTTFAHLFLASCQFVSNKFSFNLSFFQFGSLFGTHFTLVTGTLQIKAMFRDESIKNWRINNKKLTFSNAALMLSSSAQCTSTVVFSVGDDVSSPPVPFSNRSLNEPSSKRNASNDR